MMERSPLLSSGASHDEHIVDSFFPLLVLLCDIPQDLALKTIAQQAKATIVIDTSSQTKQPQASSYTSNPSTCNQLYMQRQHTQSLIHAAQEQATSYTSNQTQATS